MIFYIRTDGICVRSWSPKKMLIIMTLNKVNNCGCWGHTGKKDDPKYD